MHTLLLALVLTTGSSDWNQPSVGRPWSLPLQAEGGTAPYRWAIVEGALPPGVYLVDLSTVILGSASVPGLYGVPAEAGQWSVRVQATDAEGQAGDAWIELTVSPLHLRQAYIVAPVGAVTEWHASVSDGAAPFEFRLAPHGYLPLGLLLSADGVLRGAALVPGLYEVPVEVVDAGGNRLRKTLTVNAYGEERSIPPVAVRMSVVDCQVVAEFAPLPENIRAELVGGGPDQAVDIVVTNTDTGEQILAHYEDQSLSRDASCAASPSTLSLGRALGL